jgi:hypothetical protein
MSASIKEKYSLDRFSGFQTRHSTAASSPKLFSALSGELGDALRTAALPQLATWM